MPLAQEKLIPDDDHSSFASGVVRAPLAEEISESFLAYSLSVITARAIPDVRDGLKPVQRRILYSMLRMGLRPDAPHRKCARVVGDTMGNYHPHGDDSIYNSLVWMGQDFGRSVQLVDPQGNFGTLDDPPAASRYTECRLSEAAAEMLADIDENTVDFRPNYDGELQEPAWLPGKLPNLLVNGTSGIAVGMTTSMPPHNLQEIAEAVRMIISKPQSSTKQILRVLKGPDFPSGGLLNDEGLLDAYETGQGTLKVRARAEVVSVAARREAIVISELPYQVGPEMIVSRIKDQVDAGRVAGVADVRNLSDRHSGLRVQIDCQPGIEAAGVLESLWSQTPLQMTLNLKNMALVNGVPRQMGIRELLNHYITHRLEVVERRTLWRLRTAEERLHICEGLLRAIENIDEVVAIIRAADSTEAARAALRQRFELSNAQADAILALRLRRLVALEQLKLTDEIASLKASNKEWRALLDSPERRYEMISSELDDLARRFGHPRRTQVLAADAFRRPLTEGAPSAENGSSGYPGQEGSVVTLSTTGVVGKTPQNTPRRRKLGRHDLIAAVAVAPAGRPVWLITSRGRAVGTESEAIPDVQGRSRGGDAAEVFRLSEGERPLTLLASDPPTTRNANSQASEELMLVTRRGVAKRMSIAELDELSEPVQLLPTEEEDEVAAAFVCAPEAEIMIVADDNRALRLSAAGILLRRKGSVGVAAMKLRPGAQVVTAGAVIGKAALVVLTNLGAAKSTSCEDFRTLGRGAQGIKIADLNSGETIQSAYIGPLAECYALTSATPRKAPDGEPVPFTVPMTKRGLRPLRSERSWKLVALRRW